LTYSTGFLFYPSHELRIDTNIPIRLSDKLFSENTGGERLSKFDFSFASPCTAINNLDSYIRNDSYSVP
jgi:hypothetical protein